MAGKGPPKVPQAILEARGSWLAAARRKEGVLELPKSTPDTPADLSNDVLSVYNKVVSMLSDMGVIHRADEFAIHRYASAFVRWKTLSNSKPSETILEPVFDKMGEVIFRKRKINPKVKVLSMLNNELLQLERQFGLTPSARSYIKIESQGKNAAQTQNPKDRFFQAGS